ncbi:MAG: T9SS type A sorting domain-containing protein [Saprospiraceae bacterium]
MLTCDEIGFVPLRVYLWDSAYNPTAVQPDGTVGTNYTTCDVLLNLTDNQGLCTTAAAMGVVSGLILTEAGQPVSGVEVTPRNDLMNYMMMTEDDGIFNFELETAEEYMITPYSPQDYLNGVSTFDIVLISKHILNVQLLDSPYKLIAADINNSGTVTTLDLVHLRKAVLGVTQGFPNNNSWRFINASFEFPDPSNPWLEPFPESASIPLLTHNMGGLDFIAVKIGDINGNVVANANDSGEERATHEVYYLRTDDKQFSAGETVEAMFMPADAMDEVQGLQMTLQFDPATLALEAVEEGLVTMAHLNTEMAARGIITVSWDADATAAGLTQGESTLMGLRFRALEDGRMSEAVAITSRSLKAEAYGLDDSLRPIALNFAPAQKEGESFFLEQNRPNPFGDQTVIGFQIPKAGDVTLTIYDTHGKVVQQYRQYFAAGYNQLLVDAKDIAAKGLLYYKLETDQYAATKKMVILNQ